MTLAPLFTNWMDQPMNGLQETLSTMDWRWPTCQLSLWVGLCKIRAMHLGHRVTKLLVYHHQYSLHNRNRHWIRELGLEQDGHRPWTQKHILPGANRAHTHSVSMPEYHSSIGFSPWLHSICIRELIHWHTHKQSPHLCARQTPPSRWQSLCHERCPWSPVDLHCAGLDYTELGVTTCDIVSEWPVNETDSLPPVIRTWPSCWTHVTKTGAWCGETLAWHSMSKNSSIVEVVCS